MLIVILFWLSQTRHVTLRIHEYKFSGCIVLPDSKETELGSSDQEASPSAGKITGLSFVLTTDELSVRVSQKLL